MIRLEKGLFLEESNSLLPWGISRDDAWQIGSPRSANPGGGSDRAWILWDDVILGGLECSVTAYLPDEKNELNEVTVGYRGIGKQDPFYSYLLVFKHLVSGIGPPTEYDCPEFTYGPVLKWRYDRCLISVYSFEKHGNVFVLEIRRTK